MSDANITINKNGLLYLYIFFFIVLVCTWKERKELFYLTTHSTDFIYGYMVSLVMEHWLDSLYMCVLCVSFLWCFSSLDDTFSFRNMSTRLHEVWHDVLLPTQHRFVLLESRRQEPSTSSSPGIH